MKLLILTLFSMSVLSPITMFASEYEQISDAPTLLGVALNGKVTDKTKAKIKLLKVVSRGYYTRNIKISYENDFHEAEEGRLYASMPYGAYDNYIYIPEESCKKAYKGLFVRRRNACFEVVWEHNKKELSEAENRLYEEETNNELTMEEIFNTDSTGAVVRDLLKSNYGSGDEKLRHLSHLDQYRSESQYRIIPRENCDSLYLLADTRAKCYVFVDEWNKSEKESIIKFVAKMDAQKEVENAAAIKKQQANAKSMDIHKKNINKAGYVGEIDSLHNAYMKVMNGENIKNFYINTGTLLDFLYKIVKAENNTAYIYLHNEYGIPDMSMPSIVVEANQAMFQGRAIADYTNMALKFSEVTNLTSGHQAIVFKQVKYID